MTTKTIKTILFASLIAAMILPFSGMNYAVAQEQTEKTDQELIQEFDKLFGNTTVNEGTPLIDANISDFRGMDESVPDHVKIDSMRKIYESKNSSTEQSDYELKANTERMAMHKTVSSLLILIEETHDPTIKSILEETLISMKPRMAETGIFLNEDRRDEELRDRFLESQEEKKESFRSSKLHIAYDSNWNSELVPVTHTNKHYKVETYVDYTCEPVTCSISGATVYLDQGESTSYSGTIPSDISTLNIVEWFHKLKNQTPANIYQGTYHQGIHYDSDWDYLSGNAPTYNLYYYSGQSHEINPHTTTGGESGDKVYAYLYIN